MLLLLLLGAGIPTPVVAGVRAYAAIAFGLVDSSSISFSLIGNADLTVL